MIFKQSVVLVPVIVLGLAGSGCAQESGRLSPDVEQRLTAEKIERRADNVVFRYTHGQGTARAGWEDRMASIVVTSQSVYIHKNEKVGLEITPQTRRSCQVERREDRIRIRAGTGGAAEVWSFVPPGDAEGWTKDIRDVIRSTRGEPLH